MCKFIQDLKLSRQPIPLNIQEYEASNTVLKHSLFRRFEPIQLSNQVWISIQAGPHHESTPQEDILEWEKYSHWELAFYDELGFVRVKDFTPEFSSCAELEYYFESSEYKKVPKDLVEELYLALK